MKYDPNFMIWERACRKGGGGKTVFSQNFLPQILSDYCDYNCIITISYNNKDWFTLFPLLHLNNFKVGKEELGGGALLKVT